MGLCRCVPCTAGGRRPCPEDACAFASASLALALWASGFTGGVAARGAPVSDDGPAAVESLLDAQSAVTVPGSARGQGFSLRRLLGQLGHADDKPVLSLGPASCPRVVRIVHAVVVGRRRWAGKARVEALVGLRCYQRLRTCSGHACASRWLRWATLPCIPHATFLGCARRGSMLVSGPAAASDDPAGGSRASSTSVQRSRKWSSFTCRCCQRCVLVRCVGPVGLAATQRVLRSCVGVRGSCSCHVHVLPPPSVGGALVVAYTSNRIACGGGRMTNVT